MLNVVKTKGPPACLGDVELRRCLADVEVDLARRAADAAEIRIRHFARAIAVFKHPPFDPRLRLAKDGPAH